MHAVEGTGIEHSVVESLVVHAARAAVEFPAENVTEAATATVIVVALEADCSLQFQSAVSVLLTVDH